MGCTASESAVLAAIVGHIALLNRGHSHNGAPRTQGVAAPHSDLRAPLHPRRALTVRITGVLRVADRHHLLRRQPTRIPHQRVAVRTGPKGTLPPNYQRPVLVAVRRVSKQRRINLTNIDAQNLLSSVPLTRQSGIWRLADAVDWPEGKAVLLRRSPGRNRRVQRLRHLRSTQTRQALSSCKRRMLERRKTARKSSNTHTLT